MKLGQSGTAPVLILVAVVGIVGFLAFSSLASFKGNTLSQQPAQAATNSFLETFTGAPSAPLPFQSANWDVVTHNRNAWRAGSEPMMAEHGADCAGPPATHQLTGLRSESVFICKDHVMTSINSSDYGEIMLTPNQMVDFSQGEAIIKFDMSTQRTSMRDWVDLWISPYEDQLTLPLNIAGLPDLNGPPKRAIHIRMTDWGGGYNPTAFGSSVMDNFVATDYNPANPKSISEVLQSQPVPLAVSASRRDTFELRISKTHIKFGMPAYNYWWVDRDIPNPGWDMGVVQFGHHSYSPTKCDACTPNTWHWDNVSINPSKPFNIQPTNPQYIYDGNPKTINLTAPAPSGASLRFSAMATNIQLSFDNGVTWVPAREQPISTEAFGYTDRGYGRPYFTPIPAGITKVIFKATDTGGSQTAWFIEDISVWANSAPATPPPSSIASTAPNPLLGDLNNSGKVDIFDYNILVGNFGKTGTGIAGDIDNNGKVDIFDYNTLVSNFGKATP